MYFPSDFSRIKTGLFYTVYRCMGVKTATLESYKEENSNDGLMSNLGKNTSCKEHIYFVVFL